MQPPQLRTRPESMNAPGRIWQACLAILIVAIVAAPMATAGKDGIRRIELAAPYTYQTWTRTCSEPCGTGSTDADPTAGDLAIQITMPQGALYDARSAQVGGEYVLHKGVSSLAIVAQLRVQAEGEMQSLADHLELGIGLAVRGGTCDSSFMLENGNMLAHVNQRAQWFYTTSQSGPVEVRIFVPHDQYACLRQPGTFVVSAGAYLTAWSEGINATGHPVGSGLGSTTSLWAHVESITVELHR